MYKIIDGNKACADVAYKFSEMSFIYPITPSSPMASEFDELKNKGEKYEQKVNFLNFCKSVLWPGNQNFFWRISDFFYHIIFTIFFYIFYCFYCFRIIRHFYHKTFLIFVVTYTLIKKLQ